MRTVPDQKPGQFFYERVGTLQTFKSFKRFKRFYRAKENSFSKNTYKPQGRSLNDFNGLYDLNFF